MTVALATGITLAAAPVAGANLTDAIDGYRLEPADRMLSGERSSTDARSGDVVDGARDAAEQALGGEPVAEVERRLDAAGVDTDALRRAVERSLNRIGS